MRIKAMSTEEFAAAINAARDPKPVLRDDVLYCESGNGRLHCGKIHCAGMTARFTGHGLHGERIKRVSAAFIREWKAEGLGVPRCESCGMEAK